LTKKRKDAKNIILKANNTNRIKGMNKRTEMVLQALLTDLIISVKEKNSKIVGKFADKCISTETYLTEGLTFARWAI
jgi:hypothetical protein